MKNTLSLPHRRPPQTYIAALLSFGLFLGAGCTVGDLSPDAPSQDEPADDEPTITASLAAQERGVQSYQTELGLFALDEGENVLDYAKVELTGEHERPLGHLLIDKDANVLFKEVIIELDPTVFREELAKVASTIEWPETAQPTLADGSTSPDDIFGSCSTCIESENNVWECESKPTDVCEEALSAEAEQDGPLSIAEITNCGVCGSVEWLPCRLGFCATCYRTFCGPT